MNTITRKIQLIITDDDVKNAYRQLYEWNESCMRAANKVMTHLYFQEQQQEFFYLTDEAKILFSNINKPIDKVSKKEKSLREEGYLPVLNTSKQNTTYRVLSKIYKGDMPSSIFSNLNAQLVSTFGKEKKEYFSGKRSLRSYKRGMPMPFSYKDMRRIELTEDKKNYHFDLWGIGFKTNFGRDKSGNRIIWDRALSGEYKFCTSSLKLEKSKIYLLAVFQFDNNAIRKLDKEKTAMAKLSLSVPLTVTIEDNPKTTTIGNKEEFLHRRLAIKEARRRKQIALQYSKGGKGRKKKLKGLDALNKKEGNYVKTRLHTYSARLIDFCIENNCGKLTLADQKKEMKSLESKIEEIRKDKDLSYIEKKEQINENIFLLSNWSYFGLKTYIEYKCKIAGIELEDRSK